MKHRVVKIIKRQKELYIILTLFPKKYEGKNIESKDRKREKVDKKI